MILKELETQEYKIVKLDKLCKGQAESFIKEAKKYKNDDRNKLGLHWDYQEDSLKAHWFVGQVWLPHAGEDVFLRVRPKMEISAYAMYLECLTDKVVADHLDETISFWENEKAIRIDNKEFFQQIDRILIAIYLKTLKNLCKKYLRHSSQRVEENLVGKVRGRPILKKQLLQNTIKGRLDRVICQYQIFSVDNLYNQILKAAFHQSMKCLKHYRIQKDPLWNWASYISSALSGVTLRRIKPLDFHGIQYGGFLKPYQKSHYYARLILQSLGYDPLAERVVPAGFPPFAIDMNELFERYCEVYLRKKNQIQIVFTGYSENNLGNDFRVRPDFLARVDGEGWILDAKYKESWDWKNNKSDVSQMMTYSRHKEVFSKFNDDLSLKSLAILYPTYQEEIEDQSLEEMKRDVLFKDDFELRFYKCKVPVPRSNPSENKRAMDT